MNPNEAPQGQLVLRDIHVPAFDWWPPAFGWWISALIALVLAVVFVRVLRIVLSRRHMRRQILGQFELVRAQLLASPDAEGLRSATEFLRRVALAYHPRNRVASLSGEAWLAFLDESGGGDGFRHGPGAVLGDAIYGDSGSIKIETDALLDLMRRWTVRQTNESRRSKALGKAKGEATYDRAN